VSRPEFPFRAVTDETTRDELYRHTAEIQRRLLSSADTAVAIGTSIAWAQDNLRPALFHAWLHSEFGWKPAIGESLVDAAVNFDTRSTVFRPAAALELAKVLVRTVCAAELVKARRLVEAYRAILKGDASVSRWPSPRNPRSQGKCRRIRGRVYRSRPRRDESNIEPEEME
jgi:hypothetical protein